MTVPTLAAVRCGLWYGSPDTDPEIEKGVFGPLEKNIQRTALRRTIHVIPRIVIVPFPEPKVSMLPSIASLVKACHVNLYLLSHASLESVALFSLHD